MNNSTFRQIENVRGENNDILLEGYRYAFLDYIKIAKRLVLLKQFKECVDVFQLIMKQGFDCSDPEYPHKKDQAIKALVFLRQNYCADCLKSVDQYYAELSYIEKAEGMHWGLLVTMTNEAWANGHGGYSDLTWLGDSDNQHHLLVNDEQAYDRLGYYEGLLTKIDNNPSSPYVIEEVFNLDSTGFSVSALASR